MNREQKTVDWRELAKAFAPRTQAFIDGKYQPALNVFSVLTLYKPFVSRYWRAAGAANQALKKYNEAIVAYGNVVARDPADSAAWKNLGETLLAAGRIDDWLANFDRFEARCPQALELAVQALEVLQFRGDFGKLDGYLDGLRLGRFPSRP